ncbi:hypothetical protein GCM10023196_076900 [Actinoallomurus vinaceus]|uniref:DUF676 domain-containing protein n=1 Tax=Actinoallomurus vinaceus TaxID=1080074 RepID=A0ABP8ULV7_9ACTN
MFRRLRHVLAVLVAVGLSATAVPAAASAAPRNPAAARSVAAASVGSAAVAALRNGNSNTETVYLVHGIKDPTKARNAAFYDCASLWSNAEWTLRNAGWHGGFRTFGYYGKDSHCDKRVNGTVDSRIQWVGLQLAWDIYNNYSRHGKSVDILAHSMGGLVARAAITGVQKHAKTKWGKFPPYLYVEDAVTLSTPFTGTNWATTCLAVNGWEQCSDMRPGSGFLKWCNQNPQAKGGTDWTLIGSSDDDIVTSGSATCMNAGHKVIYAAHQGLEHMDMIFKWNGSFTLRYINYTDRKVRWYTTTRQGPPVAWGYKSLYYSSGW